MNERWYGARVAQPAQSIGRILARAGGKALTALALERDLVRRRRGLGTAARAGSARAGSARASSKPASTPATEGEIQERGGHEPEPERRGRLRDHQGPGTPPRRP